MDHVASFTSDLTSDRMSGHVLHERLPETSTEKSCRKNVNPFHREWTLDRLHVARTSTDVLHDRLSERANSLQNEITCLVKKSCKHIILIIEITLAMKDRTSTDILHEFPDIRNINSVAEHFLLLF